MYMILKMYKDKGVMSSSTVDIMCGGPWDQGIQDLAADTKNPAWLNDFNAASIPKFLDTKYLGPCSILNIIRIGRYRSSRATRRFR